MPTLPPLLTYPRPLSALGRLVVSSRHRDTTESSGVSKCALNDLLGPGCRQGRTAKPFSGAARCWPCVCGLSKWLSRASGLSGRLFSSSSMPVTYDVAADPGGLSRSARLPSSAALLPGDGLVLLLERGLRWARR